MNFFCANYRNGFEWFYNSKTIFRPIPSKYRSFFSFLALAAIVANFGFYNAMPCVGELLSALSTLCRNHYIVRSQLDFGLSYELPAITFSWMFALFIIFLPMKRRVSFYFRVVWYVLKSCPPILYICIYTFRFGVRVFFIVHRPYAISTHSQCPHLVVLR